MKCIYFTTHLLLIEFLQLQQAVLKTLLLSCQSLMYVLMVLDDDVASSRKVFLHPCISYLFLFPSTLNDSVEARSLTTNNQKQQTC